MSARIGIAVSGAGGFIGGRLCEMLEQHGGFEVRRMTRGGTAVSDPRALGAAIAGCAAMVHCAFAAHDEAANLAMAQAVGLACATARIRLVHLGTAAVYEPLPDGLLTEAASTDARGTPYKAVKQAVERHLSLAVRSHGLDLVILQPTIVYGPRGGAWTDSPIRELLTGQVFLPDAGRGLCNAVHVDDVCRAAIAACTAPLPPGERLLVSGPAPVTWHEFLGAYQAMLGVDSLRLEPPGRAAASAGAASHPPAAAPPGLRQRLRALLLGRLGAGRRSRLNFAVQRARLRLRGPRMYRAAGAKRALYEARCHVSIGRAETLLGYRPQHDLASGMAATLGYVAQVYGAGRGAGPGRGDAPG